MSDTNKLRALLEQDAAGRPVADLLDLAADFLLEQGGGPVEESLRLKAREIREALASTEGQEEANLEHRVRQQIRSYLHSEGRCYEAGSVSWARMHEAAEEIMDLPLLSASTEAAWEGAQWHEFKPSFIIPERCVTCGEIECEGAHSAPAPAQEEKP